jgi:hypothetical protein
MTATETVTAEAPPRDEKLCDLCDRRYHYAPDDRKLCYRHYVTEYLPIDFVFHRGVPAFAREVLESDEVSNRLTHAWNQLMPHVTVHVFSRKESESPSWKRQWEMSRSHPGRPHDKPWAYRGWCSHHKGVIVILVDDVGIETAESIEWIFWHELGHMAVSEVPLVDNTFSREDSASTVDQSGFDEDQKHEALSEELFVNRIATSIVGADLNRLWWRARVNAYLAGRGES